jgi:hypothetical protein
MPFYTAVAAQSNDMNSSNSKAGHPTIALRQCDRSSGSGGLLDRYKIGAQQMERRHRTEER